MAISNLGQDNEGFVQVTTLGCIFPPVYRAELMGSPNTHHVFKCTHPDGAVIYREILFSPSALTVTDRRVLKPLVRTNGTSISVIAHHEYLPNGSNLHPTYIEILDHRFPPMYLNIEEAQNSRVYPDVISERRAKCFFDAYGRYLNPDQVWSQPDPTLMQFFE